MNWNTHYSPADLLTNPETIEAFRAEVLKEKERVYKRMNEAADAKRSDFMELKFRNDALREIAERFYSLKVSVAATETVPLA